MKKIIPIFIIIALIGCTQGPPPPTLISPTDGSVLTTTPFTWSSVAEATEYRLEICKDEGFITPNVIDETTPDTFFDVSDYASFLEDNTLHYWRVSAGDATGWGNPSLVRSFSVLGLK